MRYLYNKKRNFRRADGERSQFAFFLIGAVVLLAVAFVIGLQVGRVVEKNAERRRKEGNKVAGPIEIGKESDAEIRKDIGLFSEEAGKVPSVPAPSADARLSETEKSLTFREILSRKEPEPVFLAKPSPRKPGSPATVSGAGVAKKRMVQAAAFRDRKAAETFRKRLEEDGWKASVVQGTGGTRGTYYKVVVGPYPDRDAAHRAIRKLKADWKVNAFLLRG